MLRYLTLGIMLGVVLFGCGKNEPGVRPAAPRLGGDVGTGSGAGTEQYLLYQDTTCVAINGLFMQKSGTNLTIYGDNACPHATFTECSGPVIGTLTATATGSASINDCGTIYSASTSSDSVTNYLLVNLQFP